MRCPNCGANIIFDSENQVYKCQYCGSIYADESAGPYPSGQMTAKTRRTSAIIAIAVGILVFITGLVAFLIMMYSSPQ